MKTAMHSAHVFRLYLNVVHTKEWTDDNTQVSSTYECGRHWYMMSHLPLSQISLQGLQETVSEYEDPSQDPSKNSPTGHEDLHCMKIYIYESISV